MTERPTSTVVDGVESNVLGTVTAIRIGDLRITDAPLSVVVAEHGKLAAVLEATGLDLESLPPRRGPSGKCMPNYTLAFRRAGETMDTIATAGFLCDPTNADATVDGTLFFKDTTYSVTGDLDAISEITSARTLVGDVLYGIDEIAIRHPKEERSVETTDASEISEILAAVSRDQQLDDTSSWPKCPPDVTIDFRRDAKDVGSVSYMCGSDPEGVVLAEFFVPSEEGVELLGGIIVDAVAVAEIESTLGKR